MKNFTFLRPLLWGGLLFIGYFIGTAWKTNEADSTSTETQEQVAPPIRKEDSSKKNLQPNEKATIELFQKTAPSVAFITTTNMRRNFFSMNVTEIPRGTGSAFIWDKKGHIITNYHVIKGAHRAQVTLADQSTWSASLVGAAPDKDLAVLKIDAPSNLLQPIPLGTSDDLQVGQNVLAIGNPFGLDHTLTTGIISALGREIESVSGLPIKDAIQTDAAINPGNSGGPLLDSSGKLIGVNTSIYSPSGAYAGIGFSIPVDVVRWVVPDLMQYGRLMRPSLSIEMASNDVSRRFGFEGVLVINVVEGGAADKAGLQPTLRNQRGQIILGDIIVGLNDEKITSRNDLLLALEKYKVGDKVTVNILRDDQLFTVPLVLDASRN